MGQTATPGVVRGCGTRISGGLYLECGVGPGGQPLEFFLCDPPVPMTVGTKLGVELVERNGVTHVLDWVGSAHYPYASDFLEEGARFGFSRRVSRTLDLSRLTAASRLLVVHARGLVLNHQELRPFMPEAYVTDPQGASFEHHCGLLERTGSVDHYRPDPYAHPCARDLWALPPADRVLDGERPRYLRTCASFAYEVFPPAPDAPVPETAAALIASLPITNVGVVKAEDGSHKKTLERVRELLAGEDGLRIGVTETDA